MLVAVTAGTIALALKPVSSNGRTGSSQGNAGSAVPYDFDNSLSVSDFGAYIARRSSDPAPITKREVFDQSDPRYQPRYGPVTMTVQAMDLTSDCAATVQGPRLQQDLRAAGCTQVVRGMYVSTDGRYIGLFAVFNLRDHAAAGTVAVNMGPAVVVYTEIGQHRGKDGFVLPVSANTGSSIKLGQSLDNEASAQEMGHFLVIIWVQGRGTSRDQDQSLDDASFALVNLAGFIDVRNGKALDKKMGLG